MDAVISAQRQGGEAEELLGERGRTGKSIKGTEENHVKGYT